MITLAMDAFYRQQHHDTRAWGERALDVAAELGDRPLTAAALAAVGLACAFTEAIADAELHCSRAAELIEAMPDPELAIRLDAIAYLTGAEVYLDRFEAATAHGRRGVGLARATGQGELLPMLTQALGVAFFARGLLGEAAELLDATTEAARLSGNRQLLAWNLLNRAFVAANQGEVETALAAAEESVEVTQDLDESHISMYAGVILAIARMESGNPEQAAKLFVEAAGGEGLPHVPGGWRAKYLELLTRCRIALGRIDEAERSAGFASAIATDTGLGTSVA
jgi:tetratricopeptide (TPR) repeat protein